MTNAWRIAILTISFLFPLISFGQKKEVAELQRDLALLQQDVRDMNQKNEEKLNELKVLVQQLLDNTTKANTSLAVLDSGVRDRLREQERNVVVPVTALGTKIDRMADEFRFVKESIADINSRMGKLEQRMVDLSNAVTVIQAPPTPPPTAEPERKKGGSASANPTRPAAAVPSAGAAANLPPAGLTAEGLYKDALRDKSGSNFDLALQEFGDYLRYFSDTELAPNAQYYIGEVHYIRKEYQDALTAFDLVLEKFPKNKKTLDARFMKGLVLEQMGKNSAAAEEFLEIIRVDPRSELASKARAERTKLGLSTPAR
jgi:TolA-binding protein